MRTLAIMAGIIMTLAAPPMLRAEQPPIGAIKAVKQLPITGINIIESDKGVFFVSANGRFVFKGPIFDVWNSQPVRDMADVDKWVDRVDLKKIGVNLDQLASFTLGKGAEEVVIFISPDCQHCQDIVQQAGKLTDKFKFRLVLVPLGQKGFEQTKKLWCAGPEKGLPALLSQKYDDLTGDKCDTTPLQRTLVVARVLSLPSVLYVIRGDGKTHRGSMKDLAAWLADKPQETAMQQTTVKETAKK